MKITIEVKDEHIEQALSGAFDSGGIAYWARVSEGRCVSHELLHYPGGWVQLELAYPDASYESPTPARLDRESIARGLALMAEHHPAHFATLTRGNADCMCGDVLVQLSVFGKLVFG